MKLIISIVIISIAIGYSYYIFDRYTRPLPAPTVDTNKYWGPGDGSKYKPDTKIKPFNVKRSEEEIADLQSQLKRPYKLTEPLEGINFEYGFNSDALKKIINYWRDDYLPKWAKREKYLNQFPQYTTEIQGLRIHFIHAKPSAEAFKTKKVIPLLLLHGWPGSVREFYDFIPILSEPNGINDYVFEVIAPSLVGYGWSQAAAKPGLDAIQMAVVMRNLMLRVGHEKFLVQGGDWGSIIGSNIATLFPQNVYGYHSNMCILPTPLSYMKSMVASFYPEKFIPYIFYDHHFPLLEKFAFLIQESGYFHIQATKPDTIGIALQNNPIGLAAYILEKFQVSTGPWRSKQLDTLEEVFTLDAVLDNIMIYYLSNTATSAGRFYAENAINGFATWRQINRVPSPVPMGCARFIHDLPAAMGWQLKDKFPNLIHSKYFRQGGHFAALELPVMLCIDFVEFVAELNFDE